MLEYFETCLKRVNFYLRFLGLCLDSKDVKKTIFQRLRNRRIYSTHFISLNLEVAAEVAWLVDAIISGKCFLEIVYFLPCITLCVICNVKAFSLLYYAQDINKFIDALKNLENVRMQIEEEGNEFKKKLIEEHAVRLIYITRKIMCPIVLGLLMFASGPIINILLRYYQTGELIPELPFLAMYPFDQFDRRICPWIYLHQMWAATEAIMMAYAPDCLFFTCCTFVYINFLLLNYDVERLVSIKSKRLDKSKFKILAIRHIEMMRCVELLEKSFSVSILVNAITTCIIICSTGFNALTVTNVALIMSFIAFFVFTLLQIFLYCYYGDSIERSSVQISDAIYNSEWHRIGAEDRRLFIIVMLRARKPCTLTAYGFFAMNLKAFTSILSNSWSYFALLKTMYHPE